jgi:predicted RNase H-like HicB family nuclease
MKLKELSFRIVLRPEPEGGYTVIVPSLPGCITYGETLEEAKKMAKDAIKAYLKSMEKHGEKIQDDSSTLEGMLSLKYA